MIYREMVYIRRQRIIPNDLDLVQIDIINKLYMQKNNNPQWSSLDSFDRSEKLINIIYYAKKKIIEIRNKPYIWDRKEMYSILKKLIDLAISADRDDKEIDIKINLLISMIELRFRRHYIEDNNNELYENKLDIDVTRF